MEIGEARGLAQDFGYDQRIADLHYQKQQSDRAKAMAEANAKMFADDLDFMNASNSFDNPRIKEFATRQIKAIGKYASDNPDYKYNPIKLAQINLMKKELKDNPDLQRGIASDNAFKQLNLDLAEVAKNPAMHNQNAYNNLMNQRDNYIKFGNQNGEDAARIHGLQAFVYQKPADFINLSKEGLDLGGKIQNGSYKNLGNGGYQQVVDEPTLHVAAMDLYNRNKEQINQTYNPKDDNEGIAYAKELIRPGIKLDHKFGEPHYNDALAVKKWEMAQEGKKVHESDNYLHDIKNSQGTKLSPESVTAMLGANPVAKIYDKLGNYKGSSTGQEFVPDGKFMQANTVQKGIDGKWGLSNKNTIGVAKGWIRYTEGDMDESGLLNDPQLMDSIIPEVKTNAKGDKIKTYLVPSQVEFDTNNEGFRYKYNNHTKMTAKQMSGLSPMTNESKPKITQNGIEYIYNPQTGKYE